jgi:hypothetical protein
MNITRGRIKSAIKVGIYGPEGVGKTTLAAMFPGAVFVDTEGSTKHMDVARFDPPQELGDVLEQLSWVLGHPEQVGTLVIDTVDWLEKLIFNNVCAEKKIQNIEDIGYGKGYVYAKQKMQQILEILDAIVARGVHVVLVCHSMIRKFEQPDEMGSYDRYMLKLNEKNIAPIVKEWLDMLLFCNYKTDVVTAADGKTKKARGGQKRIMYANHSACWDAKNRFGLPDEMPMEYDQIAELFGEAAPVEAQEIETPKTEPPKPVDVKKDVPATVTAQATLPAAKQKKPAKKDERPTTRPDYLRSDNPEKDDLLEQLWQLMVRDSVWDPTVIQAVVAEKEYYDLSTPIRDYDSDFIEGCLIGAWETVRGLALTKIHDLPF